MSKIAAEKVREFRAEAKFQRTSPQKAKLVLDLIKGLRVEQALNTVHFSNKRMAPVAAGAPARAKAPKKATTKAPKASAAKE